MIPASHASLRILIVDDKPGTGEQIERRIAARCPHCRIATERSGRAALTRLARDGFDVILCDLRLAGPGGLDGIEVTRRALAQRPATRVVVFTGTSEERKADALAAGAFSYLAKPIDYDELLHTIETINSIRRTEKLEQGFRTLAGISADLAASLEPEELTERIARGACALGYKRTRLYLLDPTRDALVGKAACGMEPMDFRHYQIPLSAAPLIQRIFREDRPTIWDEEALAGLLNAEKLEPWVSDLGLRGIPWIDCPLRVKDRRIGTLAVDNRGEQEARYSQDDLDLVGVLASLSAQALDNSAAYESVALANASLRSVLEDAPDAVVTTDLHGVITFASPSTQRITGYSAEAMMGRHARDFYTDATGSRITGHSLATEIMDQVRRQGTVTNRPVHLVGRDGQPRRLMLSVSLLHDPGGREIGTLGFLKELTILEAEGQRYRELLEGFGYGSMQLAVDGTVDYLNRKAALLLGRPREQVEGKSFVELVFTPHRAQLKGVLAAVGDARQEAEIDLLLMRPDGSRLPVKVHLSQLRREGVLEGVAITLFDKSELQALIRSGRLMALGQMASGVAHEINNPLNNLMIALFDLRQALEERGAWRDEERESYEAARRNGLRISDIVERMTRFTHSSEFEPEPLALAGVVEDATSFFRISLQHRNIGLKVDLPPGLPLVRGERSRLQQVFVALLTNATEALEQQEGDRSIRISAVGTGDQVLISICDNGPGIPEGLRDAIFDPFFTTKKGGTGLGLFIVQSIVQLHGGSIRVQDAAGGRGICFLLELPRAEGSPSVSRESGEGGD